MTSDLSNGIYTVRIIEDYIKTQTHNGIEDNNERIYDYEEAINLTGNGWYNCGLLAVLSLGLLGMAIDIFGFSVLVTGSACDFELELWQRSIMLSMPFVGPVLMSIAWGYISDTQGRRKTLLITLWGAFVTSFISAFSVNWVMLAVLKVFSSSFCSAVQSVAYALLNESCSSAVRGAYMLIMTSVLMLFVLFYVVPGYFILNLTFAYDLGIITFIPWRLLAILLSAPLGVCAFCLHFFYESPKFLVNDGQEQRALQYLAKIWARNGREDEYPVRRVVLHEPLRSKDQDIPFWKSLWLQTIPLFKPPLLWISLPLFYLTTVIYCINNSLIMWMPYIVEAFTTQNNLQVESDSRSLCSILAATVHAKVADAPVATCSASLQTSTLLSGVGHGLVFASINLVLSKLASRKKTLMIAFLLIPTLSSVGAVWNQNNVMSLVVFVGMTMTNLCMGVLFSYYVMLFPTSYSGMAGCLGVMIARISGLAGVQFVGRFVMTNCTMTFYAFGAYLFSGVLVAAFFLPTDNNPKELLTKSQEKET